MNTPRMQKPFQLTLNSLSNNRLPPLRRDVSREDLDNSQMNGPTVVKPERLARESHSYANSNKRLKIDCSEHNNRNKTLQIKTFDNATSEQILPEAGAQTKKLLLESSSQADTTMKTMAETSGINSILVGNRTMAEDLFKSPDVSMMQSQGGAGNAGATGQMIMSEVMTYENPTDEMNRRWKLIIEKVIPAIDIIDLSTEHDYFYPKKRQFAPEYS